jgi:threonine dehydratase
MYQAMSGIEIQMGGQTLADGIAVKTPGGITKEIITRLVDEIEVVSENLIELAILRLAEEARVVSEGAGASGLAALLKSPDRYKGRKVVVVICGGNIDTQLYANVLRRGLIADQRIVRLRVRILDIPGVLSKMASIVGDNRGNIIDVAHQRYLSDIPAKNAELDITIETPNSSAIDTIRAALDKAGFPNRRLRDQTTKDLVASEQI